MCVCVIGLFSANSRLGREGRGLEFGRYRNHCLHTLLSGLTQELAREKKELVDLMDQLRAQTLFRKKGEMIGILSN